MPVAKILTKKSKYINAFLGLVLIISGSMRKWIADLKF